MNIKFRLKHFFRFWRILRILSKYGLADELASLGLGRPVNFFKHFFSKRVRVEIKNLNRFERIRFAVEEMGTTAIKFAQILSTRTDLMHPDLIAEFEKLQDNVPPFSVDEVKEILWDEWGSSPHNFLASFDDVPLAAASIAQVHRALLKDGSEVVIKVQRPKIADKIQTDIELMHIAAAEYMKRYGDTSSVDVIEVVSSFESAFVKELSFLSEAANQTRFSHLFESDPYIYVPKLHRKLCTEKVLVMEYVNGIKITDLALYPSIGSTPEEVAKHGLRAVFRQIFEFGFFHGDPHPGNMFVMRGNTLCFIDFGMMGGVLRSDLYSFADILLGIRNNNPQKVINGVKHLMVGKRIPNERKLLIEIDDLIYSYNQFKKEEINLEYYFNRIRTILHEQKIQMPGDFFVLVKAMVTIEGVGRKVYPQIDVLSELEPYLKGVFRDRYSPGRIWERIVMNAGDVFAVMETLPGDTLDIITNIKEITGKYDMVENQMTRYGKDIKKITNKIELAIVLGIWLICSTILVAAQFPPLINGWSLFGSLGYIIALIAGYRLLKK
jgi:ubiquinone biosynthesis protein